ncbi:MAG: hypothetical protein SFY67_04210 [Candidatus Melainabacteria bacterium]|nr:hypothetical protein [Candidatus Melainabacteria bacterium]
MNIKVHKPEDTRSAMKENEITEEDILKEVESRGFKRDDLSKK